MASALCVFCSVHWDTYLQGACKATQISWHTSLNLLDNNEMDLEVQYAPSDFIRVRLVVSGSWRQVHDFPMTPVSPTCVGIGLTPSGSSHMHRTCLDPCSSSSSTAANSRPCRITRSSEALKSRSASSFISPLRTSIAAALGTPTGSSTNIARLSPPARSRRTGR